MKWTLVIGYCNENRFRHIENWVEIRHDRQKGFYCSGTEFNMKYIFFFVAVVVVVVGLLYFCGYEIYFGYDRMFRKEEGIIQN